MSDEIVVIDCEDKRYPPLLRQVPDRPGRLYVRGSTDALCHSLPLAVVGTRSLSRYGETVISTLVGPLARAGCAIISGLALGADALIHADTLAAGGITVAVLAGGVDKSSVGPRSNARLAERIVANGGALISEYPPGTENLKHHFPMRNRIVAGMSAGTLVVEAPLKSGALITARAALEYGRDVFAVPGPITYPSCAGANALIAQGATPACSPGDVADAYGISLMATKAPQQRDPTVIALMAQLGTPQDIDSLAEKTGMGAPAIIAALSLMEMGDLVRRTDLGWVRKIDTAPQGRLL